MSIWVRLATADDAGALSALALQAKRHWGYPPDWIDRWREELTITSAYLAEHTAFVAAENGAPIGMCVLEKRADGGAIENVWIAPDRHCLGIGRALVMRALREAAIAGMPSVQVVSDPFAEGFYTRLGAERRGQVPSPMPSAPDRTLPVLVFAVPSGRRSIAWLPASAGRLWPGVHFRLRRNPRASLLTVFEDWYYRMVGSVQR